MDNHKLKGISSGVLPLALVLGFAGIGQFFSLDRRPLWSEEVYALTAAAGHSDPLEIDRAGSSLAGRATKAADVASLARITPRKPAAATAEFLFRHDRHHFPAYYLILKLYGDVFGDSTAALRLVSALAWSLSLVSFWFLGRELGLSPTARGLSLAFFALSPTFFFYAQTIREYSLWTSLFLLSHLLFLRALRKDRAGAWAAYGAALTLALYTSLFSSMLLGMHAVIGLVRLRKDGASGQQRLRFLLALGVPFLILLPFGLTFVAGVKAVQEANTWAYPPDWTFHGYIAGMVPAIGSAFWSLKFGHHLPEWSMGILVFLALIPCARFALKDRDLPSFSLLVMALTPLLAFIAYDLTHHSIMIFANRYLLISLAPLALTLGIGLDAFLARLGTGRIRAIACAFLLAPSLASIFSYSTSHSVPLMNRPELSVAVKRVREDGRIDRVVSFSGKSTHLWPGLARKLPPETDWIVLDKAEELAALSPEKLKGDTLVFLPPMSLVTSLKEMPEKEKTYLIEYPDAGADNQDRPAYLILHSR